MHPLLCFEWTSPHHQSQGAPSLLLHPSVSLPLPLFLSVSHLISCFALVSLSAFMFYSLPLSVSIHPLCVTFPLLTVYFFHMFGQLWMEIRLQVAWALCAGTRVCVCVCACMCVHVCVFAVWLPFPLFHCRILSSWVHPLHYTLCVSVLASQQLCGAGP